MAAGPMSEALDVVRWVQYFTVITSTRRRTTWYMALNALRGTRDEQLPVKVQHTLKKDSFV